MKRSAKQIVSLLLVFCMCLALMPALQPEVEALTPQYSVSSAYKASSYYSSLLDVKLTGDHRDDIINVALSQVGYTEGSSTGDYGGANDGEYINYTEYNYWFHNNISSAMPVGGTYAHWCACFVSWCAEQAQIPTSILQRSTAAGHSSSYFNLYYYAGGSTLNASSDDNYHFLGYNYIPKKGDLFYTRTWGHVGLVVAVEGSNVITVEGNTNDGGAANGEGVFVRTRSIADLYFGVPEYVEKPDYAASCTYYPAHCTISIDSDTPINTQPCAVSTEHESENIGTAAAGETYTATGLYLDGDGDYWYRVTADDSQTGYLYAGDATYVEQLTSDITVTGYDVPGPHIKGNSFSVTGTVASTYNKLNTVSCNIYTGFDQSSEAVTGASATASNNRFVLDDSTVDYNTAFGSLSNGNHTYVIAANYTNYYLSGGALASNTETLRLLTEYFVVVSSSVNQSSCSHSYTTVTVKTASCTENGLSVASCGTCGTVNKTESTASGHAYGDWTTVDASCVADGYKTRTCATCGNVDTQIIAGGGHDYTLVTTPATCVEYEIYEFTCGDCGDNYKLNAGELASDWIETLPEGLDSSLFVGKLQYRYRDYQSVTSNEPTMEGYTCEGMELIPANNSSVTYVKSWPSGFSTDSDLYSQYNNQSSTLTASDTDTQRTVIDSDAVTGYLYYHWCRSGYPYSVPTQQGSYTRFHAFYSTTAPENYTCDTSDNSYKVTGSTACSDCQWYFYTEVYTQNATVYDKLYTHGLWTEFTDWSDEPVTATDTREVETRTVYQLKEAALGDHVYVDGFCTGCGAADPTVLNPSIKAKAPSLSFEGEIFYNFYCELTDIDVPLSDIGLITWAVPKTEGTVEDAGEIIPGATKMPNGQYVVRSNGIPAKNLGDTVYFKVYAKLSDGSYVYSKLYNYSGKDYALDRLENSTSDDMKALCVAMLNYGAAAQLHFGYKTYSLMNASLTAEQQALVMPYAESMVSHVSTADSSKIGEFANTQGYSSRRPSVSFEGAFAIAFYVIPKNTPANGVKAYYWTQETYNSVTTLTRENADGCMDMDTASGTTYKTMVEGIAAKEIDKPIYVSCVYEYEGVSYATGVMVYSLAEYCVDRIANGSDTMKTLAEETAVYGYYAKQYFAA